MFIFYIHILLISYSRALLTFMWILNKTKTPAQGIHHPSMMDVHTKVLLSVENEIFLLHTNRRSVRIQTTFRPSPKVTLEPGTLLDSIQPRTLCLVPPTSVVRSVVCVHYVVLLYYIDPLLL